MEVSLNHWWKGAALSLLIAGCDNGSNRPEEPVIVAPEPEEPALEEPDWGYSGDIGPENWASLSDDYASCSQGVEQSPIDVDVSIPPSRVPAIVPSYSETPLVIFNNGRTVEVEVHEGDSLTVGDSTWDVVQFHFHASSEHTFDGSSYALEMHVVHANEQGDLAVLGVAIEAGEHNEALDPIFNNLPQDLSAPTEIVGVTVNLADVLPEELAAWRYAGSLTTPPCSEGVAWHVLSTPIEASLEQIGAFEGIFDNNFRPAQALNERSVDGVHWGYGEDNGPSVWGDLSPYYESCRSGLEQSPIDIASMVDAPLAPALEIDYSATPLVIFNNGHTVEVEHEEGSSLMVGVDAWEVLQFHFHASSEHTLDDSSERMEMHIVHRSASGELAVLGAFIEEGMFNPELEPVFANLPREEGEPTLVAGQMVNLSAILPMDLSAWRYNGSLTTPPCSEGVRWHVLKTPIQASASQIALFETVFDNNFRPTQALNDRTL